MISRCCKCGDHHGNPHSEDCLERGHRNACLACGGQHAGRACPMTTGFRPSDDDYGLGPCLACGGQHGGRACPMTTGFRPSDDEYRWPP
jgi:hypothetical protein